MVPEVIQCYYKNYLDIFLVSKFIPECKIYLFGIHRYEINSNWGEIYFILFYGERRNLMRPEMNILLTCGNA